MIANATEPKAPSASKVLPALPLSEGVRSETTVAAVFTLVLWLTCLLVGWLGFALPYARPRPPAPAAPPVQAELIKVELVRSPAPTPANVTFPPPDTTQPPPLFAPPASPQAPQLIAVAMPSPAVTFALPIEAPARIVEVKQAAFVRPAPQPTAIAPSATPGKNLSPPNASTAPVAAVQTLTFGQGEGTQPAPRYPDTARRAGQEGTVIIRFSVGTDGRVLAAEPSAPSPWGALNREALRVVREQWRFKPGPTRLCEVAIRFELKK